MARFLSSRRIVSPFFTSLSIVSRGCNLCSEALRSVEREDELRKPIVSFKFHPPANPNHRVQLPTSIPAGSDRLEGFSIELVDPDLWRVSFGAAEARSESVGASEALPASMGRDGGVQEFHDFDEIETLRLQKKLFYKLDRGSKEFEECNVSFHKRKSSTRSHEEKRAQVSTKKEGKKQDGPNRRELSGIAKLAKEKGKLSSHERERHCIEGRVEGKKVRTQTFNQLTDPYHLPFCLDIYITKGSVRACIVHRVTSKVVAVAHSISKDMKFDLTSRKDSTTCAAVGRVLAQRGIEDDIHNVVYTPRKGDKIEGKLQIVLQSIIDHGIDVKVKLKQKRPMKRT